MNLVELVNPSALVITLTDVQLGVFTMSPELYHKLGQPPAVAIRMDTDEGSSIFGIEYGDEFHITHPDLTFICMELAAAMPDGQTLFKGIDPPDGRVYKPQLFDVVLS